MKTVVTSSLFGLLALAVVFLPGKAEAQAYHNNYNGCPSVNVYYSNGYANNYCVPSYTPSYYPAPAPGYNYGYGSPSFSTTPNRVLYHHSPHPFGPSTYNQPFYPYTAAPTYYYPPAPRHHYGHYGWRY